MKIYDLKDASGRAFAFEVSNLLLTRRRACEIVRGIPSATIIAEARFQFPSREDVFCQFEVGGQRFKIWEPFGDNSRYWVGPEPPQWCEQLAVVRDAFVRFKPFAFRRVA